MCNLVMVIGPCQVCTELLLPPLPWVRGAFCCSVSCSPTIPSIWWGIQLLGVWQTQLIPLPSLHGGEGSSVPGLVPSNDTVESESAMGVKPVDSGVVIGYQIDEFTSTWSAEWFVAHSHIYPGLTGKVSSLTHFPLEPGCEDYSFLGQAVAGFEQGLDSILTDSLETPELDTSLDETDVITSSVSSGFLHLVSTLSDNSKPQLASDIHAYKLWCQARALLAPVSLATKMSASKLINYFSIHSAAFGFWASTPPDNTTLTSANKKAYHSLRFSYWCWGCCSCHLTQSNSSLTSRLPLLILFFHIIPVSEVCELLLKVHNILDIAVFKQVGNSTHILVHVFNPVTRQHCEVWASQFPFLHSLGMWFLLVRLAFMAIFTGLWHRLSNSLSMGLSQTFPLSRSGKARPWTRFHSTVQKNLCKGLVVHLWLRDLTWRVVMRLNQVARSLLVAVSSPVLPVLGGKGAMGAVAPDVLLCSASSSSSSVVFQVGMLLKFLGEWRCITSNRFVLNMVWGHHLQLRYHPPLFYNFWQFNVKEIAKGVTELSGGAGIYSSVFVVPKHTDGLQPTLNPKHFNHYLHIPLLRCQLSDMCSSLLSMVIMLSPSIFRMAIYVFLLLSIIIMSYSLVGKYVAYQ